MIKEQSNKSPSAIGEFFLWVLVGIFSSAMALVAMTGAKYLLGWSETEWIVASVVVGACSLTWGSWAALLWTRSRVLKTLMMLLVVLPGIAMAALGVWAFFAMPENRWIWRWGWLIVAGHGVGSVAVAVLVGGRRLFRRSTPDWLRPRQLVVGWTLYPVAVVGASVAVVVVAFALWPDLLTGADAPLEVVAHWIVPSQALALLTTVVPATTSALCDRLTRASGQ